MRLKIKVEAVGSLSDLAQLIWLYREVFEKELGIVLPAQSVRSRGSVMHLLARCSAHPGIIGALTVVDTTRNPEARDGFDLPFPPNAASARLTNLAVLPRFRGMGIPARLFHEAMTRFIRKRNIEYTWLCYNAGRAASSWLCRDFGFQVLPGVVGTQYGACHVLVRDEFLARSARSPLEATSFAEVPAVGLLSRKAS